MIHNETFANILTTNVNDMYDKKQKRDIWKDSDWKYISELENDDVGKVGESVISDFCKKTSISSDIDGIKTKKLGGGIGDGIINGRSIEIKTARLGSNNTTFQHELGEKPWNADYMIFLDIAPKKFYITIFPNFDEDFYKKSGCDSSIKCTPYFPSKSITWRKQKGAFKLDTSININEKNKNTFIVDNTTTDFVKFEKFVLSVII